MVQLSFAQDITPADIFAFAIQDRTTQESYVIALPLKYILLLLYFSVPLIQGFLEIINLLRIACIKAPIRPIWCIFLMERRTLRVPNNR